MTINPDVQYNVSSIGRDGAETYNWTDIQYFVGKKINQLNYF
jgi:hypothetical protein